MTEWVAAGQSPDAFWRQTPRMVGLVLDGARQRHERETELAIVAAWQTARLTMTGYHSPKKFPPLARVLPRKARAARVQDWRDIQATARLWCAVGGGKDAT